MIVYVGIDFGTSYSKVSFSSNIAEKIDVIFDEDNNEYKPSVLYFSKDRITEIARLYYKKPAVVTSMISYFKYTMINEYLPMNESLHNEKMVTKNHEILCSLFFLAWLIKETKKFIVAYYKNLGIREEIDYRITMGVPIENYNDINKKIYDNILFLAEKLSSSELVSLNYIDLEVLDAYYQNNSSSISEDLSLKLHTLPELYTEAVSFFNNPSYDDGIYGIVDIGGGTVDIAIMKKENIKGRQSFQILCQLIKPCGIEIVTKELSGGDMTLEKAKNCLLNLDTDLINNEIEKKYNKIFGEAFREMALTAKRKVIGNFRSRLYKIVLCGGGSIYKWYQRIVQESRALLSPTGIKYDMDISGKFFKDHRLIISRTLAQPYFNLPIIEGFPWDIENSIVIYRKEDPDDNAIKIYGKPL